MVSQDETVLVVDDEAEAARINAVLLERFGYGALIQNDPLEVEALLRRQPEIKLVLLDIQMPRLSGLDLLRRIKIAHPQVGVVMATVLDQIDLAVEATKSGAYAYLLKPLQPERLSRVLQTYFANRREPIISDPCFTRFVTGYRPFAQIFKRVQAFAKADVPVLIEGETGTGKELIAGFLHGLSARCHQDMISLNVAALHRQLFESELFGHGKSAFTGATNAHWGYFHVAGSGTLFLDEIGELDVDLQKKLLRAIESKRYCRVGETIERELAARLILATNRNLREEIQRQSFRQDLYYRLSSFTIKLPPLRERSGDIPLLAHYFFAKNNVQFGRELEGFHPETMKLLERYHYPGNVRELEGIISSAVLIEQHQVIMPESLPESVRFLDPEGKDLETVRYRTIMDTLAACDGNQSQAAKELGIARSTLNLLLKQYRKRGYRYEA